MHEEMEQLTFRHEMIGLKASTCTEVLCYFDSLIEYSLCNNNPGTKSTAEPAAEVHAGFMASLKSFGHRNTYSDPGSNQNSTLPELANLRNAVQDSTNHAI
ncbi:hypothetical protein PoB_004219500 [Plakobranchus ocellatus]|uniref:Uncharacterized protein n=1 Tax=Plakobranchus ocellatus TaxID=259542 RepID=A0AAV4B9B1_9GAST|nr:hypothetical protein PoB_004219500 [Plakobranchus ocellatus]